MKKTIVKRYYTMFELIWAIFVLTIFLVNASIIGGLIYVGIHFASKYW